MHRTGHKREALGGFTCFKVYEWDIIGQIYECLAHYGVVCLVLLMVLC